MSCDYQHHASNASSPSPRCIICYRCSYLSVSANALFFSIQMLQGPGSSGAARRRAWRCAAAAGGAPCLALLHTDEGRAGRQGSSPARASRPPRTWTSSQGRKQRLPRPSRSFSRRGPARPRLHLQPLRTCHRLPRLLLLPFPGVGLNNAVNNAVGIHQRG